MEYKNYRYKIKSGDLLAWSHKGIHSWHDFKVAMVRAFTRSEYSHVGVAWVIGGRVFVIEAVKPCVRIFPLSSCGDFYHTPLNAFWSDGIEEMALDHVGDEYSELDAIKAFLGIRFKSPMSECAALAISILKYAGVNLGTRATPDAVVLEAQKLGNSTSYIINKKGN